MSRMLHSTRSLGALTCLVFGLVGSTLDSGGQPGRTGGVTRWKRWRPSVDLVRHKEQPIARFEGLHLANQRLVATYPGYVPGQQVPDPLAIVVTMNWNDFEGRPRTMRLATMKGQ